jgi:hypothetical protein
MTSNRDDYSQEPVYTWAMKTLSSPATPSTKDTEKLIQARQFFFNAFFSGTQEAVTPAKVRANLLKMQSTDALNGEIDAVNILTHMNIGSHADSIRNGLKLYYTKGTPAKLREPRKKITKTTIYDDGFRL